MRPAGAAVHWDREPSLCGVRRFTHRRGSAGDDIAVPVCATPAVVTGVGVIVGGYDGRIRLLDGALQHEFWQRRLDSAIYAALAVDHVRQTVLVAATRGEVACLDLRGRERWRVDTGREFYARPVVLPAADLLVLSAFGSRCLGLDVVTGALVFDRELPRPWSSQFDERAAHRDPYASPVVNADETVVVCCAEHVLCLAPDGSEVWRREIGHAIRSSPVALHDAGELAVCAVDGRCRFLDAGSGAEIAAVDIGAKVVTSPAVSGGTVIVGATDDSVVGIDIAAHRVRWRAKGAPRDHSSFSVLPGGDFVATTSRGNAVARRRDNGAFLWETSQLLGLAEHDPAMDTTPMAAGDGSMYCGSYSGMLYQFRFRPKSDDIP